MARRSSRRSSRRARLIAGVAAAFAPSLELHSDVGGGWNAASVVTGTPAIATVDGVSAMRFSTGSSLAIPANAITNALATGHCRVIIVWRSRTFLDNRQYALIDSSSNNTHIGYQLRVLDNYGSGYYREMRARVSNGSSWVVDQSPTPNAWNAFRALLPNVTVAETGPLVSRLASDHIESTSAAGPFTMPVGASGDLVFGGVEVDIYCAALYVGAIAAQMDADPALEAAEVDRLARRYGANVVQVVAGDGVRHIGIPGACKLDANTILVVYRNAADHNPTPAGWLEVRKITTSDNWVTASASAAYEIHDTSSPTVLDIRDANLVKLANGDILVNYFTADSSGYGLIQVRRSTDGGNTFGAPVTLGPFGYTAFEACSAPIIEDPLSAGTLYLPAYCMNTAGFSDSGYVKSTDNGVTWGAFNIFANGTTDSAHYYEPGLFFATASIPNCRLPGGSTGTLTAGKIFGLVRDGTNFVMRELTANANGTGWTLNHDATIFLANSAGRLIQFQSGRVAAMQRPFTLTSATVYARRGTALNDWADIYFDAAGVDATTGIYIYGSMLEMRTGYFVCIYSPQFGVTGANWSFVRMRTRWPEGQLVGSWP